jgi:pyruvate decarboxylase
MKENAKYKRGILVTGEGSLHLTVQAFADLLRFEVKPIMLVVVSIQNISSTSKFGLVLMAPPRFVLNNAGYTIERLIHGPNADYNTVAEYDYSALAQAFGPQISVQVPRPYPYGGGACQLVGKREAPRGFIPVSQSHPR